MLADTSVWVEYLRARDPARGRMKQLLEEEQLITCGPVVAELLAGVDERAAEELWASLIALPWAPLDAGLWQTAARAGRELRRQGRRLPLTDMAIGVAAARERALLWTRDADFERLAEVVDGLETTASG